ncbi:hypothetical protein [uncultured Thiodictyon sp.]|uniref:hypothetical protein n=1 Tax=uncultured Thiodictyon sp. TaxID=1846217 RepID=UPI0025E0A36A|nr:hypothetical protein [uncultured Thiodictyon sp.]
MFDSLYIEIDGKETEVQTKRFDCCLASYRIGDCIDGASPGVRVYFDELDIDQSGRLVYGHTEDAARSLTLFVVLIQGVFADYSLDEGRLEPKAIEQRVGELRERWADSARAIDFLVGVVMVKQQRIAALEGRIAHASTVLASARRLRAGEELKHLFGWARETDERLIRGDDPLDVFEWALGDGASTFSFRSGRGASADPLEEYRL